MSAYYQDGAVVPEFARLMVGLAETLGAKLSEERIRGYAQLLGDLPPETLRVAFVRAANRKWYPFPQPAEIRECVATPEADRAVLAWVGLERAAREAGAYADLVVEDAAAAHALLAVFGGWVQFAEMDDGPQLTQQRAEFFACYRQAARMALVGPVRLTGRCATPEELAALTWVGRVSAVGDVRVVRDAAINRLESCERLEIAP